MGKIETERKTLCQVGRWSTYKGKTETHVCRKTTETGTEQNSVKIESYTNRKDQYQKRNIT